MRWIVLIILCLVPDMLFGQLTLDECRREVVESSLTLRSADNSVEKMDAAVALARTKLLPELSASGRFAYNLRRNSVGEDWGFSLEPQIVQTLYGGGSVRAGLEYAKIESEIARRDREYSFLEVCYAADYAYWNLWAMGRYHRAMGQYVEIIEEESEIIRRRFAEGYISKGDLLMIEARLTEAEYELVAAEKSREVARNNLNILRGVNPADSVVLAEISPDSMSVPIRIPIEQVLAQRPDFDVALLAELAAQASTRSVRGAYNPSVVGGVGAPWRTYTPNQNRTTYLEASAYVALSVPIYRFGERRKAVAVSRASEQASVITTAMLRDNITKEESNAWSAVVESRAQMSTAARSLRIASENLDISTYSYNEGVVSIVELMQAQISWIQIYTNAINSEYNYQIALSYYHLTVGK